MVLLRGGEIIDPAGRITGVADVLIDSGKIIKIAPDIQSKKAEVIDVSGLSVMPGLVDVHVHLRDPGYEYKENVETGLKAAAAGGFTTVVCMPNTSPAIENKSVVKYLREKSEMAGLGRLWAAGAATKERKGRELAEIGDMMEEGIAAITDDGSPVANPQLMRRIFEYAKIFDLVFMSHAEVPEISSDGVMHEGLVSTTIGLPGIPPQAESVMVARDVQLAKLTGGRLHVTHISTPAALDEIRRAKDEGLRVTCDVTPHHLTLTDEAVMEFDTCMKVNPPLRPREYVEAMIEGLKDGTIDAIASDHAPHAVHEKETPFNEAPFGMIGLETTLAVTYTKLVKTGAMTLRQLAGKLSAGPAGALGLDAGRIEEGAGADITVFDPEAVWTVDPSKFYSLGRNCPYAGWEVSGKAVMTIAGGRVIAKDGVVSDG